MRLLYARDENLTSSLGGSCVSCGKEKVSFTEEWHLSTLYKIGTCGACKYEHHLFVRKM